jgi:hypothetical protein
MGRSFVLARKYACRHIHLISSCSGKGCLRCSVAQLTSMLHVACTWQYEWKGVKAMLSESKPAATSTKSRRVVRGKCTVYDKQHAVVPVPQSPLPSNGFKPPPRRLSRAHCSSCRPGSVGTIGRCRASAGHPLSTGLSGCAWCSYDWLHSVQPGRRCGSDMHELLQ